MNMREIERNRKRTVLDSARVGDPVIDTYGMTWWLVEHGSNPLFACASTLEQAQASTAERVDYVSLHRLCSPLWIGSRNP